MRRDPALAAIAGALTARPLRDLRASLPDLYADLTERGMSGCRAPAGRFAVTVDAWPPSKSNTYRIIHRRDAGGTAHAGLASGPAVVNFEWQLADAVERELRRLRYQMRWFTRPRVKSPDPANPLFGADVEVAVTIAACEPWRTDRDTGNVEKVVGDVLTAMGIWWDDRQVGDIHLLRAAYVGVGEHDQTCVVVERVAGHASWDANPGHRPVSTRAAASLGLPPALCTARALHDAAARVSKDMRRGVLV